LISRAITLAYNTLSGAIARMRRLANGMTDEEILEEFKKLGL
jgi:hypothetical protein